MGFLGTIVTAPVRLIDVSRGKGPQISKALVEAARLAATAVLLKLETNSNGLSEEEYEARVEKYGPNQAALTGEALPVEKSAPPAPESIENPLKMPSIFFLGSNVESGTGTALVVKTGSETYFGSLATSITGARQLTSFDKGVNSFTWLMISFMLVMGPMVFLFNGLSKHNWIEAFLFALAVAVGAWLTISPLAGALGLAPLPPLYWLLLLGMLAAYMLLTQVIKTWFVRHFGE